MGLLDGIEKLITEHGSAAILRQRIALAREQFGALQRQCAALEQQLADLGHQHAVLAAAHRALQAVHQQTQAQTGHLQQQLATVHSGNPSGYVCDHCGSPALQRTGNRPDPAFGVLGVKQQVFTCTACHRESAFTP